MEQFGIFALKERRGDGGRDKEGARGVNRKGSDGEEFVCACARARVCVCFRAMSFILMIQPCHARIHTHTVQCLH